MKRRDFLKNFTLLSSTACAPTFLARSVRAAAASGMSLAEDGNPNRILVVIELAGGCDGLNTVVPYTNDFYYSRRPQLAIPSSSVLRIDDEYGFHPSMTGIKELFDAGELAIVQGVGYPNPDRSHFRSRDIWYTGEPEKIGKDGWLAKYVDLNPSGEIFQAVNVGGKVPKAMISAEGSSPSIQSIDTYSLESDPNYPADAGAKNDAFQQLLGQTQPRFPLEEYVTQTILDATLSSVELLDGVDKYQSTIEYPDTPFATNLKTIAQIIAAELKVSVFYATIGGFDTHASQVSQGNSLIGTHADLLATFSGAVSAFMADIREMGRQQDVVVMTFSEFGRRLSENGSQGTDHGTANQMFLLGDAITPGFHGTHPSLAPGELDEVGDMVYNVDFRSVYASVLANWLGVDPVPVLGPEIPLLDLL